MEKDELEALASGRVWTGDEALQNRLVDAMGDLDDAIELAAQKAGVEDDYRIRVYPVQQPPFQEFLESLSGDYESRVIAKNFNSLSPYIKGIETLKELEGVQARSFLKVVF